MFLTPTYALGPLNATIHKVDEHIDLDDLTTLSAIYYEQILVSLLVYTPTQQPPAKSWWVEYQRTKPPTERESD